MRSVNHFESIAGNQLVDLAKSYVFLCWDRFPAVWQERPRLQWIPNIKTLAAYGIYSNSIPAKPACSSKTK